jgi:hypothetical protein
MKAYQQLPNMMVFQVNEELPPFSSDVFRMN